jgi:Na+-transporting methylmalonyl-CoA/oxaloacetate decarboxylase gamma subunit
MNTDTTQDAGGQKTCITQDANGNKTHTIQDASCKKEYTTLNAVGDMFVIYGIVIVVSMLVALVIRGIVIVLSRQAEKEAAKAPVKPAPVAQPILTGVPQEHLAVITAAVAAMLGAHRIVRIETPDRGFGWTSEARSSHHTSHAPRASH